MDDAQNDRQTAFDAARARLYALAYRMLGSRAEAEDVVQDAWLKWHAADAGALRSPAAWLTTITTHLAIDRLRHLQTERASRVEGWLPEPWLETLAPSPEELALRAARMSYGVMLLLDHLKPEERAAFVLHEAFDCDYAEIAKILGKSRENCRQIVHRAKERLKVRAQRAEAAVKLANPAEHARVVERLRAAMNAQDRADLVRLFCDVPEVVGEALETVGVDAIATRLLACAESAEQAETVQIDGMRGVALLRDGEIDALLDVRVEAGKIVVLRVVRNAALLQRANDLFGHAAVRRLLQRIGHAASTSVPVCRDFPVDIDA